MKRKLLLIVSTLIAAICLICGLVACDSTKEKESVQDTTTSNDYIYSFSLNDSGDGYTVTYARGGFEIATIPAEYDNLPVTAIGNQVFMNNSSLTTVIIPDSVTSVGRSAFCNCTSLASVTMGSGLLFIGEYAFDYCTSLTSVTIPDSVTSIGDRSFRYCTSLKTLIIGSGVTSIDTYAFYGCTSLEEIHFNATAMTDLSSSNYVFAYAGQSGSGITVTIGSGVTRIPAYLFYSDSFLYNYAAQITKVIFETDSQCTNIGKYAFYNCEYIEEIYFNATAMDDLSSSNYVFAYAGQSGPGITVTIGECVTKIPAYLFDPYGRSSYSPKITTMIFEDNSQCTSIGKYAFHICRSLTSVTIPASVNTIGNHAFYNCENLLEVHIGDVSTWCEIEFGDEYSNPLYYADELYLGDELATEIIISDNVTYISDRAFYSCKTITSVIMGANVTSVGDYAFYNCNNLLKVTVSRSLTSIGNEAFRYCYKLIDVYNMSSLNLTTGLGNYGYISYYALCIYSDSGEAGNFYTVEDDFYFYEYGDICYFVLYNGQETDITIPDVVNNIEYEIYQYAFCDDTSLISVTIGSSVTSIGDYAFRDCTSLTSVSIGSSVTSIGDYAFRDCTSLNSVVICNAVSSIGNYAFYNCKSLVALTIGEGMKSIGKYAFENCKALETIYFNAVSMNDLSGYNNVFDYAGQSGSGITVMIGAGVTKIPAYLFNSDNSSSYAPNITSVIFDDDSQCTSIGSYAFAYCSSLVKIIIPRSLSSFGNYAFYGCNNLSAVYYCGDADSWTLINVGSNNSYLLNCTIYYYSDSMPSDSGNYWYRDSNGEPVIW